MASETNQSGPGSEAAPLTREVLERNQRAYVDIVAKYYGDPDFKAQLDKDPTGTISAEGLDLPEGAEVKLVFNSEKLLHVVLPARLKKT